ncbi:MAG: hypothetical protein HZA61_00245 [Candidatus Eisenbacteria bacterium]|uniref:Uncharacterized protein n=1 Tax=Eiseniibacteriota bacterium TaxID=2212470 RepID=A0A933W706_UNCEI|nr:hypothetical protein [Candidatus Eisenbacteria bacterium]
MARKPVHADAELLLRLYEIRREPELRKARAWFLTKFEAKSWDEIGKKYLSHTDEDRWFRMSISYWEMVATMVQRGVLHDELFFEHTGEDVVTWERCKPWIAGARAAIRPTYLHNFEAVVAKHVAFRNRINAAAAKKQAKPTRAKKVARRAASTR